MRTTLVCTALILAVGPATLAGESWPQWGGPDRNFTVAGRTLADDWGEEGPKELWSQPLGGGFASIVSDGKNLFVAYRDGEAEIVAALDAATGETRWQHRYAAPIAKTPELSTQYGEGPNGTPLLVKGKLLTLGFTGKLTCLDAGDGTLQWAHDLGEAFKVKTPYFGHATSPLAVGKTVVVVAGGLLAFDLTSGELAWENRDYDGSYGSPVLVGQGSRRQIVSPVSGHLAGFDPKTGKTLWAEEHKNQWGTILTTPVVDDEGRVFISAAQVGSILVDPASKGSEVRRVWQSDATQTAHSNLVRLGEWVIASTGDTTSFVSATSLTDGRQAWKQRGFARANLLRVGDQYLLLDFDGELALVDLSEDGMKVVARATINDQPTWTPPTLLGTTLYVRDESRIRALDLSPGE